MSARVEIVRDSAGVPSLITARDRRGHRAQLTYRSDVGFEVRGKVSPEIAVLLALVPSFGKVAVDIVAQTIGNIAIDIAAQTVGNITVDLAAQSVGNVTVDLAANSLGNLTVDLAANSLGNLTVDLAAASIAGNLNVNIAAQTLAHLHTDIVAQSVGNIGIDIKAQTVGNVNVNLAASAATVTITGATTISTTGGTNIVIDQLTQGAFTERRAPYISNNGAAPSWVQFSTRRGKFFPRGCRGFLREVQVYLRNSSGAAKDLTVRVARAPEQAYMYTATVSVPDATAAGWFSVPFNLFWDYDACFVYFLLNDVANFEHGYDTDTPFDQYDVTDDGDTSASPVNYRSWMRLYMAGETVGDVPVSGTVNNVPILNTSASRSIGNVNIPNNGSGYDTTQYGSGNLLYVLWDLDSDTERDSLVPSILLDGNEAFPMYNTVLGLYGKLITATSLGVCIGVYDTANHYYSVILCIPKGLPFKRSLQVGMIDAFGAGGVNIGTHYTYEKIT